MGRVGAKEDIGMHVLEKVGSTEEFEAVAVKYGVEPSSAATELLTRVANVILKKGDRSMGVLLFRASAELIEYGNQFSMMRDAKAKGAVAVVILRAGGKETVYFDGTDKLFGGGGKS